MIQRSTSRFSIVLGLAACCGLAIVAAGCSTNPAEARQRYIESGDKYAEAGKLAEAILEYRNAVQQDEMSGEARVRLADAYVKAGDGTRALEQYVRAADLLPDDATVQLKAGQFLLLAGRFGESRSLIEKLLARDPANVDAQILFANSLAGLKDFDAAVSEIEEAIQMSPSRGATYSNLGALELSRGKLDEAEAAFRRAVEIDSRSAPAHLALANFFWVAARWPEAEQELRTVIGLEPDNVTAHRGLANFFIATNRAADAEEPLKRVAEITKAPEAAFALADYYVARRDTATARTVLEPMTQTPATTPLAEVRLAALDHGAGDSKSAYARLDRVLGSDPTHLQALLTKTSLLQADGRLEEALSAATVASEKHRESAAALFALGRVQSGRRQIEAAIAAYDGALRLNPRATNVKVALAQLHLAKGQSGVSATLAQEALAAEPENADARLTAARALIAQKELGRAEVELRQLATRFPNSATVQVQFGVLKGLRQDEKGAREHFEKALQLDPDSPEAVAGLVALDLAGKRPAAAVARVDERLKRTPNDVPLLMTAARTHAAAGNAAEAERLLRRTIEADPNYLPAYGALAQLYVAQRRLDAALTEFDEIAKRDPKSVAAMTFAGIILDAQGKTAEARARYERALAVDPEAAVAANNLAWLYAHSGGNLDTAVELARVASRKLPTTPEVTDTLGVIYIKKGQLPEAIETLNGAVKLNPDNPTYHFHLGQAYAKAGDNANALRHLKRALTLAPNFQGAAEARSILSSLPPA